MPCLRVSVNVTVDDPTSLYAMAWQELYSGANIIPILILFSFIGPPKLNCDQIQTFSLSRDPMPSLLWNKIFHTFVPQSPSALGTSPQSVHCCVSCMQLSSDELPCNAFLIHKEACYLGDVNGNHSLIEPGTPGTEVDAKIFSNYSEGMT